MLTKCPNESALNPRCPHHLRVHGNHKVFVSIANIRTNKVMVLHTPKVLDDGGEIPKCQGKRLAVRFPAVKSPLYLT